MSATTNSRALSAIRIADFEDFSLGQRFAGGERTITAVDLASFASLSGDRNLLHTDAAHARAQGFAQPLLHGPFGLAAFFGWFYELDIARTSIIGLLDTDWRYLAPLYVGDRVRFEMTITRLKRVSSRDRGVVGRHVRLRNQDGTVVQEGSTSLMVRARGSDGDARQELFSRAWAERLAERLNANAAFRSATATWDGTFGLAAGEDEAQFRIYRGKVVEAGVRTPNGPTFSLVASDLTWAEMVSGTKNDFMTRAMHGAFAVRGNAYEYLRLTKAVSLAVDSARELYHDGSGT